MGHHLVVYLLFPGRHHLVTGFQRSELERIARERPEIEAILFAVTSADHSGTRRNPLPLHQRAMMLHDFGGDLTLPSQVFEIDDVGKIPDFAEYTLRRIESRSGGRLQLTPENTVIFCSTPSVIEMYRELGFAFEFAELIPGTGEKFEYRETRPWEVVESVARGGDDLFHEKADPAAIRLWQDYRVSDLVRGLFSDELVGDDGDLTETRDYNSYVRQMDENMALKYAETADHIVSGRVGDIGCAVGSWIKMACEDPRWVESEYFGVEISRALFEICEQRKTNGEFANPFVFFSRRNAATDRVFPEGSMHTIHTSSLTHEIFSYAGKEREGLAALRNFIRHRAAELHDRGVWINRDVVGPEEGDQAVRMTLSEEDGLNEDWDKSFDDSDRLAEHLGTLSTGARFRRFVEDYRPGEERICFEDEGGGVFLLSLRDAWEFATKKDYLQNWKSEMHERFCFWSYSDWERELQSAGLELAPVSNAFRNEWIYENRLRSCLSIHSSKGNPIRPPTTVLLVATRSA